MSEVKTSSNFNSSEISPYSDGVTYLLNQIQRLNLLLLQRQKQVQQAYLKIAEYQSEQQRHKQNLSLIVVLFAEIESLRNQLNQNLSNKQKQHQYQISTLKLNPIPFINQPADFELIKELQCNHQDLIKIQKTINETKKEPERNHKIEAIKHIDTYSHPSQSIQSSKSLSSNNSIQHSISSQYYKGHSSPKFVQFVLQQPLYKPLKSQRNNTMTLGSYGKISESKNIDSSDSSDSSIKIQNSQKREISNKVEYKQNQENIQRKGILKTSNLKSSRKNIEIQKNKDLSFLHRHRSPLTSSIEFNQL